MAVNGLLGGDVPEWLGNWLLASGRSPQVNSGVQNSQQWLNNWASSRAKPSVAAGAQGLFNQLGPKVSRPMFGNNVGGGGAVGPGPDPAEVGFMDYGTLGKAAGAFTSIFGVPGLGTAVEAFSQNAQANAINENVTIGEDLQAEVDPISAMLSSIGLFGFSPFGTSAVDQLTAQDNMFGEPSFSMTPFSMENLAHMSNPNIGLGVPGTLGTVSGDAAAGVDAAQSVQGVAEALGVGEFGGFGGVNSDTGGGDDGDSGGGESGGDDASGGCWVAGTQVIMGDNSSKNIEDLKIGDMVMSFPKDDQRWNTPLEPKAITELTVLPEDIWWLNDTGVSKEEWVIRANGEAARVKWLEVGDKLMTAHGTVTVKRVEPKGTVEPVFNFMTEDNYSYTADGIRTVRGIAVKGSNFAKPTPGKTMRECYKHVFKEELK